jgi:hypothetical protein
MPRSTASRADRQLIAHAARHGAKVTARHLERWRASGLLGPNVRRALGRGRGSTSEPPAGAGELVVWLARNAGPGRRPGDLALLAFAAGLAVPEATVRASFVGAIASIRLPVEVGMPPGAAPEDVADAAVAAGQRFTMVPARVRRIDRDLAQCGVNWALPELAALDPGRADPRADSNYWAHTMVRVMLCGGAGIDMGTVGAFARAMAPIGGVAPLAGQVEYRWPLSPPEERDAAPDDEDLLALLGSGDLRDQARDLAMTTSLAELRDAFQLAAGLPGWADGACAAVEREIVGGQPGEAAIEWFMSALGVTRLLIAMTLRGKDAGPASTAVTTVVLIMMLNVVRAVRQFVPAQNADVLDNPLVGPAFLVDFLNR